MAVEPQHVPPSAEQPVRTRLRCAVRNGAWECGDAGTGGQCSGGGSDPPVVRVVGPGSGPRLLAGENGVSTRDRCSAGTRRTKDLRGRQSQCLCVSCGALCMALWRGGEPTPGRFPTQLVYVVVRTNYAATTPRHNRIRRAEDPHDSVTAKIREHRRDASSGVEVGAAADGLPGVDLVPECVERGAEAVRGVVAEEQHVRGVVGLDGLDECGGGLGGVAGLGAVDGVVLLAALAGGVGVVSDDGGGLSEGAAGEVGAEGAGLDDSSGDADRCDFLTQ